LDLREYAGRDSNIPQKERENRDIAGVGGTDSVTGADAGGLETLAAVLRSLTAEDSSRLGALLIGEQLQGRSADE
jgi:hypothetical protein